MNNTLEKIQGAVDRLYGSVCFRSGERSDTGALCDVFIAGGRLINCDEDPPVVMTVKELKFLAPRCQEFRNLRNVFICYYARSPRSKLR
jgi:hypothetical protein